MWPATIGQWFLWGEFFIVLWLYGIYRKVERLMEYTSVPRATLLRRLPRQRFSFQRLPP